ncbi:MAG: STAS domain-containing protein [Acetobacteraceae bacterium]
MDEDVVAPTGRLDGPAAPDFLKAVTKATAAGAAHLMIDFSEVSYISSAGLRVILIAAKTLAARGGRLALCSLGPQVARVIELSDFAVLANLSIHSGRDTARLALSDATLRASIA